MSSASRRTFLTAAGGAGAAALTTGVSAMAADRTEREVALLSTYVAGIGNHAGPAAAARLQPGEAVALRREPGNDYDTRAVAVWSGRGEKLGYVPRVDNKALASLMDAGLMPQARVQSVTSGSARPEIALDVRLTLRG